jgi:hypothetical protein
VEIWEDMDEEEDDVEDVDVDEGSDEVGCDRGRG